MYHYERRDFDMVSRTYRSKDIEDDIARAEQKLKEGQENIGKYIAACREQLRKIASTEFKRHVFLKRQKNWATKHIQLFVGLLNYPEDGEEFGWVEMDTERRFRGTERKKAREYAEQLATEYRCEVKMEGF